MFDVTANCLPLIAHLGVLAIASHGVHRHVVTKSAMKLKHSAWIVSVFAGVTTVLQCSCVDVHVCVRRYMGGTRWFRGKVMGRNADGSYEYVFRVRDADHDILAYLHLDKKGKRFGFVGAVG